MRSLSGRRAYGSFVSAPFALDRRRLFLGFLAVLGLTALILLDRWKGEEHLNALAEARAQSCRNTDKVAQDTSELLLKAGSLFAGDSQFTKRILRRHCDERTASLVDKYLLAKRTGAGKETRQLSPLLSDQLALVREVSEACPKSFLPFVSREMWAQHADLALMDSVELSSYEPRALATRLATACKAPLGTGRACVVFLHTQRIPAAAEGLLRYLEGGIGGGKLVLVSSSNVDLCVPFHTYGFAPNDPRSGVGMHAIDGVADAEGEGDAATDAPSVAAAAEEEARGRMPQVHSLLRHPKLIAWFAENPCLDGASSFGKLRPVPIGPKQKWHDIRFGAEDWTAQKAGLVSLLEHATRYRRGPCRGGLLIAMNEETSDLAEYRPHEGIRREAMRHMKALARAVEPPEEKAQRGRRVAGWLWGVIPISGGARGLAGAPNGSAPALETTSSSALPQAAPRRLMPYPDYLTSLARHKFAWSPPGRGMDAHRTWECLLAGCVPIVLTGPLSPLYEGLSVVETPSFDALTARELEEAWEGWAGDTAADWLHPSLFGFHWLRQLEIAAGGPIE